MTFSSPIKDVQAAGVRGNASFRQPPGGLWSGTVLGNDHQLWKVDELEDGSWQLQLVTFDNKVNDVYAGPDLEQLLRDHLVAPAKKRVSK